MKTLINKETILQELTKHLAKELPELTHITIGSTLNHAVYGILYVVQVNPTTYQCVKRGAIVMISREDESYEVVPKQLTLFDVMRWLMRKGFDSLIDVDRKAEEKQATITIYNEDCTQDETFDISLTSEYLHNQPEQLIRFLGGLALNNGKWKRVGEEHEELKEEFDFNELKGAKGMYAVPNEEVIEQNVKKALEHMQTSRVVLMKDSSGQWVRVKV